MRTWRVRELKLLAQDHMASRWQGQVLKSGLSDSAALDLCDIWHLSRELHPDALAGPEKQARV